MNVYTKDSESIKLLKDYGFFKGDYLGSRGRVIPSNATPEEIRMNPFNIQRDRLIMYLEL